MAETATRFYLARARYRDGPGLLPGVSLAEAREKAAEARKLRASGVNPIEARRAARLAKDGAKTFGEVAETFVAAKSHEWRNLKHRMQLASPIVRSMTGIFKVTGKGRS